MSAVSPFIRLVALRYLWTKRSEAFITIITVLSILGVAVGVMVMNIAMAIMTGFEHELKSKILGTNSHIVVRTIAERISGWRELQRQIATVNDVQSVSPFTMHQALLRAETRTSGALVRGVDQGSSAAAQLASYLQPGSSIDALFNPPKLRQRESGVEGERLAQLPGVIIGRELSRQLGVIPGDTLLLFSPTVTSSPAGLAPHFRRFIITGIYQSGLSEYEGGLIYVSLPEAQRFFRLGDTVSGYEIRVGDPDRSRVITAAISDLLRDAGRGLYAEDWTESNRTLWEALKLEKNIYFIVLLLIIVMASVSIVTTLVLLVIEKRRDIAVMKTLGATSGTVARIFVMQGTVIGVLGTVLGLTLGYTGCLLLRVYGFPLPEGIWPVDTVPVRVEWENFVATGVSALLVSALATLYPAWRASRLDPCEVLRYE